MIISEERLPIGSLRIERTGDYLFIVEVVGWSERLNCNLCFEKKKVFFPKNKKVFDL